MQIFVGGSLLGGCNELLQLVADKQLHKRLQQAQGKAALPKQLQDAVDTATYTSSDATTDAAFMPEGVSKDDYARLQQLAASMEHAKDDIQW